MINLVVGGEEQYLANEAKKIDPGAMLVDFDNYKSVLSNEYTTGTIYTSPGDLPKVSNDRNILYELMTKADTIFYMPPAVWSDHTNVFSWAMQQIMVEYLLTNIHQQRQNVVGLEKIKNYCSDSEYLKLVDVRPSNNPCLWIAGCSVSKGVGVETSERYGDIISAHINMPSVNLSIGGSSLEVQSDQILRSDIQQGDILVWGLTSELRAPKFNKFLLSELDIEIRTSETRMYKAITSVQQVINFCEKMSVQLLLLPLICTERLRLMLVESPHYHNLPYQVKTLDLGTDNMHPGPMQHLYWANYCINFITKDRKAGV